MAQQEKFNFHHTFQGTEYANGICNFHSIFYMIFCFRKPFYAPCELNQHTLRPWQAACGMWSIGPVRTMPSSCLAGPSTRSLHLVGMMHGYGRRPNGTVSLEQHSTHSSQWLRMDGPHRQHFLASSLLTEIHSGPSSPWSTHTSNASGEPP